MFGLGMWELVVIAIVALLALGPERLPQAAKTLSKGIRDFRKQTRELQATLEDDHELGDAIRDLKSALHGDPLSPTMRRRQQQRAIAATASPGDPTSAGAKSDSAGGQSEGNASAGDDSASTSDDAGDHAGMPVLTPSAHSVAKPPAGPGARPNPAAVESAPDEAAVSSGESGDESRDTGHEKAHG